LNWQWHFQRIKNRVNQWMQAKLKRKPKYAARHKMCPSCGKFIDAKSIKCEYCEFQVGHLKVKATRSEATDQNPETVYAVFGLCVFFFAIAAIRSANQVDDPTLMDVLRSYGAPSDVLMGMGASVPPLVLMENEYWRLATYIFLHANLIHIVFNLSALALFGPLILEKFGMRRFWLITLVTGMAGGFSSTLFHAIFFPVSTVGLSGALFGFIGALYAHAKSSGDSMTSDRYKKYMIYGNLLFIAITILGFPIDNVCHIGGMFAGVLLGFFMYQYSASPITDRIERILLTVAMGIWIWGLVQIFVPMLQ